MAKLTPEVQAAVDYLVQSYGDINAQARGFVLNGSDVQSALASADADSAEYVALKALANANPIVPVAVKAEKKPKIVDVDLSARDKQVDEAFAQVIDANSPIE